MLEDGEYRLCDDRSEFGTSVFRDGRSVELLKGDRRGTELRPGDEIFDQETFGPLVGVARFSDFDEAMALANGHGYGLSSSIYTTSATWAQQLGFLCSSRRPLLDLGAPPEHLQVVPSQL